MSSASQVSHIQSWIDRLKAGDRSAREQLLAHASDRLVRLTRKMLRDFPGVHRWEETDDVLQNALLRLHRALAEITPPSAQDFFRLAAALIRRELLDMARKHSGPMGLEQNLASQAGGEMGSMRAFEASDQTYDPDRLSEWTGFHLQVEKLPDTEREVFDLLFYQGLSQAEAADVLGVVERTVKRRWQSARLALHDALDGRLPGS